MIVYSFPFEQAVFIVARIEFGSEETAFVFFLEMGLKCCQRMFFRSLLHDVFVGVNLPLLSG